MKLTLFAAIGLFAHFYPINAQQCGREFQRFRQCLETKDKAQPTTTPPELPKGSISEEIINCFLNNGCQIPRLAGEQAAGYEVLMGALIKCSDAVKDQLKPMIQQCMVNTQNVGPGYILHPDQIAPLPLTMPNPPPAPPAIVVVSAAGNIYNDKVCPPNVNKARVRSCVDGVSRRFIPFNENKCTNPLDANFDLNEHCYNRKICQNDMSATCKQDYDNIRNYLCNCAKQTFPDKASTEGLVNTFTSCVSREFGDSQISKPSVDTFVQYAPTLVTNLMCMAAPDPCKPQPPPQQGQGAAQPQTQPGQFSNK